MTARQFCGVPVFDLTEVRARMGGEMRSRSEQHAGQTVPSTACFLRMDLCGIEAAQRSFGPMANGSERCLTRRHEMRGDSGGSASPNPRIVQSRGDIPRSRDRSTRQSLREVGRFAQKGETIVGVTSPPTDRTGVRIIIARVSRRASAVIGNFTRKAL